MLWLKGAEQLEKMLSRLVAKQEGLWLRARDQLEKDHNGQLMTTCLKEITSTMTSKEY
jgi:hypothetical protein